MKLLGSGYVATETTMAGTTAGGSTVGTPSVPSVLRVRKIVAWGQSSVITNSSGGIKFRYTQTSSGGTMTTLVVLPVCSSNGMVVELGELDIQCRWFDAATEEAGDSAIFVFGD